MPRWSLLVCHPNRELSSSWSRQIDIRSSPTTLMSFCRNSVTESSYQPTVASGTGSPVVWSTIFTSIHFASSGSGRNAERVAAASRMVAPWSAEALASTAPWSVVPWAAESVVSERAATELLSVGGGASSSLLANSHAAAPQNSNTGNSSNAF